MCRESCMSNGRAVAVNRIFQAMDILCPAHLYRILFLADILEAHLCSKDHQH